MPVGIENLATGFLQGLNARKQQERQDVIDQREAERFDMQKQQFAGQQEANALSLKTNQFQLNQAQKTADRGDITWNQQQDEINRKKAFESDLRTIYSLEKEGNTEGLAKFLTEKNKTLGIKGDFERDYVTGKGALKLDKDGKAVFVHEDGTRTVYDMDDYGADFVAKFDPVTAISNKQKTAAEIAKENREHKQKVELVGLNAANAEKLAYINNKAQDSRLERQLSTQEKIANIRTGAKSEASYEPLLPLAQQFFGSGLTSKQLKSTTDQISKDEFIANGLQNFKLNNVGKFISTKDMQQAEQSLNQLADSIYGQQSASTGNTQQAVLKRVGLVTPKNLDGGGIDMSDFSLTPTGGGGNNMQNNTPSIIPASRVMPVPQVIPTASYRVPTNKGYVLYDENGNAVNYVNPTPTMPIDVVNAVRDAIPDMPPPRRMPAGQNFFSGSNPFEKK